MQNPKSKILLLLLLLLLNAATAFGYNSEEHKLLVDAAMENVRIPEAIPMPEGMGFEAYDYLGFLREAKEFAVGFSSNNTRDYDKNKRGIQDNGYYEGMGTYCQGKYNRSIFIPMQVPEQAFWIPSITGTQNTSFTIGELSAVYGDYRRTTVCDEAGCYLTPGELDTIRFDYANYPDYVPERMEIGRYLRYLASGVVPPFGCAANTTQNSAYDEEYDEAGWWGDEMLRIANANDWHFSNAAIAWYVGLHRLALYYVDLAQEDPRYWVHALHHESNALHSYTDLFAFGHVVTQRGETAYGIINASGLRNRIAYQWMENCIEMGGGMRDSVTGIIYHTPQLPEIEPVEGDRVDFLPSYRGAWWKWTDGERIYHDEFNTTGGTVINLKGQRLEILGDGLLHTMPPQTISIMEAGITASIQSLFDAYQELSTQNADLQMLTQAGSPVYESLKYLPVFIESDRYHYFTGQWTRYAGQIETLSAAGVVPSDWETCQTPHLSGKDTGWPEIRWNSCTEFPF